MAGKTRWRRKAAKQIQSVQCFHVVDQPGQHIPGAAQAETARGTFGKAGEEPDAQSREGAEGRFMGEHPLAIAQHHPGGADDLEGERDQQRATDDGGPGIAPGIAHEGEARREGGKREERAESEPAGLRPPES
jgi:hypothetical protein